MDYFNSYRYLLWFEVFNSIDRVRLWNRLVFSENYMSYIANNRDYDRRDLQYIIDNVNERGNKFCLKHI